METLPFITIAGKKTDKVVEVVRSAIFEINNLLTIPMKILDVELLDSKNKFGYQISDDHTGVVVKVEACADHDEWALLKSAYLIGANTQSKITNCRIAEKYKHT